MLLSDWSDTLRKACIVFKDGQHKRLPLPNQIFGKSLQTPRKLDVNSAQLIESRFSELQRMENYDLISYRHKDGAEDAVNLVQSILKEKRAVWWDRWSLPRRLAEGREALAEETLENEIFSKLAHAKTVYGVMTDGYCQDGAFTLHEQSAAGDRFRRSDESGR